MSRNVLVVVLSISLLAAGCSAQWVSVALADLPVLTQMALNIAALVATLQSGKQLTPAESLAIQNISAEASKDLTLLQALCNAYKTSPSADTLHKIESLIQDTNQNLPALLQAAHIGDPALSVRIAQGSDGRIYALEVCDAVEADSLGYEIDGVLVSDFITPVWFEPAMFEPTTPEPAMAGQLDFKGRIKKALELAAGGYISVLDRNGRWTQVAAQGESAPTIPVGSRRQRRNLEKSEWRKSTSCASALHP